MSELRRLLPSLNTLVVFEAAVRCGTFARAAKELGVTGPAVSRAIGRLELHLGVPLFHRTPSGAVLTGEGSELLSGIAGGLREIENALSRIRKTRRSDCRPIVLSVSSAFATHWFMPRLARFQAQFPKVEISCQLINGPLHGPVDGIDIAMRFDHAGDARHVTRALMPEVLIPVRAPHFVCAEAPAGAFMPATKRIITLSKAQPNRPSLFSSTPDMNSAELSFSDYTVVVQAALVGQGVAVGWLNVVSHLLACGSLVPAGSSAIATGRTCELVTHRGSCSSVVSEICDWMLSEFHSDIDAINVQYPHLGLPSAGHRPGS